MIIIGRRKKPRPRVAACAMNGMKRIQEGKRPGNFVIPGRFYSQLIFDADFSSCGLLFAQYHFAVPHQLIVQPQPVFVRGRLAPRPRRPAQQSHSRGRLKNIGRKRAAVHVKFHAQISRVRNPGDLVAVIQHHRLWYQPYKYRSFSHFCVWPASPSGPELLFPRSNSTIAQSRANFFSLRITPS
jgi:hypothetical protein